MLKNLKMSLGALALGTTMFGAGAAFTSQASAQAAPQAAQPPLRGEVGSARNISKIETHLRRLIANLQRDQRDYGGHRVQAINFLNQADQQLEAALQFDATSGH